jgi:hypothetical protein
MEGTEELLNWLETKNDSATTRRSVIASLKEFAAGDRTTIDRVLAWAERAADDADARKVAFRLLTGIAAGDAPARTRALEWLAGARGSRQLRVPAARFLGASGAAASDPATRVALCDVLEDRRAPVTLWNAAADVLARAAKGDGAVLARARGWLEDRGNPDALRSVVAGLLSEIGKRDRASADALCGVLEREAAEMNSGLASALQTAAWVCGFGNPEFVARWAGWLTDRENPPGLRDAAMNALQYGSDQHPVAVEAFLTVMQGVAEEPERRWRATFGLGHFIHAFRRGDENVARAVELARRWATDPAADTLLREMSVYLLRVRAVSSPEIRAELWTLVRDRAAPGGARGAAVGVLCNYHLSEEWTEFENVCRALLTDETEPLPLRRHVMESLRQKPGTTRHPDVYAVVRALLADPAADDRLRREAGWALLRDVPEGSDDHALARTALGL